MLWKLFLVGLGRLCTRSYVCVGACVCVHRKYAKMCASLNGLERKTRKTFGRLATVGNKWHKSFETFRQLRNCTTEMVVMVLLAKTKQWKSVCVCQKRSVFNIFNTFGTVNVIIFVTVNRILQLHINSDYCDKKTSSRVITIRWNLTNITNTPNTFTGLFMVELCFDSSVNSIERHWNVIRTKIRCFYYL